MGTRVAPTFACIFMGWLEKKMLGAWKGRHPRLWKRYIDDIIFLWTGSKQELLLFTNFLNTFHPTIKFKCNEGEHFSFETRSVNFLDVTLFIDDSGYIQTTLYSKPGKLCQYLLPSSCHPNHITRNIPYSLAYRLLRIESIPEKFKINLENLRRDLLSRKYSPNIIQSAFFKVQNLERENVLQKVEKKQVDRIPLVIPYHPGLPNISSILRKHWKILMRKFPGAEKFIPQPPMVSYTRDKNLRDILVRAVLPPLRRPSGGTRAARLGFFRCGKRSDCILCSHSVNCQSLDLFDDKGNMSTIPIKSKITCTDENLVYAIVCTKQNGLCNSVRPLYFGETGKSAKWRCAKHIGSITNQCQANTSLPVGAHFRLPGHSHSDFKMIPFEKISSKDPFVRKIRESFYIDQFKTVKKDDIHKIEHGLNLKG